MEDVGEMLFGGEDGFAEEVGDVLSEDEDGDIDCPEVGESDSGVSHGLKSPAAWPSRSPTGWPPWWTSPPP